MQIILKADNDSIKIPVLPPSWELISGQNHQTVDVVTFGELLLKGTKKLDEISFSSFFPASSVHGGYEVQASFKEPLTLINKIINWKDKNKVIRLIITETNVNAEFLITSFNFGQSDATGDYYYSLSLKEYRRPKVYFSSDGVTSLTKQRSEKEIQKTYTVKSKDTLKSIAKAQLGSSAEFKTLAKLNYIPSPYKVTAGQVILLK